MDAVYLLRHSVHRDAEIRYSLRGLHAHAPWIRKVWIVGDRPRWLSDDRRLVEHVDYRELVRLHGRPIKTPVRNCFLATFLIALHPEISAEFLWMNDDFILLRNLCPSVARRLRYAHDLSRRQRPSAETMADPASFQAAIWRTADVLRTAGYTTFNAETHTPSVYRKRWIVDAYCEFSAHVAETRLPGMLFQTAVLNHAHCRHGVPILHRETEGLYVAWHQQPPTAEQVARRSEGKLFLNCDDKSFPGPIRDLLESRFPAPCPFETPARRSSAA